MKNITSLSGQRTRLLALFAMLCALLYSPRLLYGQCCLTNSLNISTGYDPNTLAALPLTGAVTTLHDPKWTVTAVSASLAAMLGASTTYAQANTPSGSWPGVLTGTQYISFLNSSIFNQPDNTSETMTLTRSFHLCQGATVTFNMTIIADDYVTALNVDGLPLGAPTFPEAAFAGSGMVTGGVTAPATSYFLPAGDHYINVSLTNVTSMPGALLGFGLDLSGTITTSTAVIEKETTACSAWAYCTEDTITGPDSVCAGVTITLSDAEPGGVWSSSNTAIATVGAATGIVTGVSGGTVTISYIDACLRVVTHHVTVNQTPAITGTAAVCLGSATTLHDATSGGVWSSSATGIATISTSGVVTSISAGTTTISYTLPSTGCSATQIVTVNASAPISGVSPVCVGNTVTFSDPVPGGTWSSAYTGIATVGATTGIVTAVSAGVDTIIYTTAAGCRQTFTVTVNPSPSAITGIDSVCAGHAISLTDAASGGTWSSSTTSVATVSSSGSVTGVTGGTATITYSLSAGCYVLKEVTINPTPTIYGATSICANQTVTLTDLVPGGTWSSSSATIVSVGLTTGIVSPLADGGGATVTYTAPSGCIATTFISINPIAGITGIINMCVGISTLLTDGISGGTWSSSNPTVASIGLSTGIVVGLSAGTSTMTYTTAGGCTTTTIVTVNPVPGGISGVPDICIGATTTYSDATSGGTWSSLSTSIATVSSTGVVTGVSGGSAIIEYTLPGGCSATKTIIIDLPPTPITGTTTLCTGSVSTLSDGTPGGSWSSSSSAVVSVGATTGIITGVSAGTATVSYILANGCGMITVVVTVNDLPSPVPISGTLSVCKGMTTSLSDTTSGGTWSSSATSIATISTSGVATGVNAGVDTIKYTTGTGCYATALLTVNPRPADISGPTSVCAGLTISLSDATTGGAWSSSAIGIATVDASTGIVTGISAGSATITYTSAETGCITALKITVNPLPEPITGVDSLCPHTLTTLSDASSGGTWSSSVTAIATVGATTGVVTGAANGTTTITYTLSTGCLTTVQVTVDTLPVVLPITGTGPVCQGSTITLADATLGGTWSSVDYTIASVSGGVVLGVMPGTTTIRYNVTNNCGTSTVSQAVTVATPLTIPPITGDIGVCSGLTDTLYDSLPGGTWSSSTTSAVTIDPSSGVITGIATGTSVITYAASNVCGTTYATTIVVVNMPPYITSNFISACQSITNNGKTDADGVLSDSVCMLVCDSSIVRYYGNGSYGSVYTWAVTGGTIVANYGDSIDVFWPMAGLTGTITLFDTISHCTNEAVACVMIIQKPHALFTASSTNLCLNDNVVFTNMSTADSLSTIVSYYWNFGDGGYSAATSPTHSFTLPNPNDTVTLVVTNQCGCKDTFKMVLNISETPGPVITCASIACQNDVATYSTSGGCGEYDWSVTGGVIISGAGTSSVTVKWNMVGADGFGYVSLAEPCGPCPDTTTIKIPVILANGTITGPGTICAGQEYSYSLPLWAGTQYMWGVLGHSDAIIGLNNDHTVTVYFTDPGTYTLHGWYQNRIKLCGANLDTVITVVPPTTLLGDTDICQYSTDSFSFADAGTDGSWTISDVSTGSVIATGSGSSFSYTFGTPGVFIVGATGAFCANPITVVVHASPSMVDSVIGPDTVCLNRVYGYLAMSDIPGATYSWTAIGGTVTPASGNQVSVVWTSGGTKQLLVSRMSNAVPYCTSLPKVVDIHQEVINPNITGDITPCANAYRTYNANYTRGEVYDWTISPNTAGSVTQGNHSSVAIILWNNVAVATPAAIVVTVHKCDSVITDTLNVTINPSAAITLVPSQDTACPNTLDTFTASAGGLSYLWTFGDGTSVTTTTNTVSHAFPLNTTTSNTGYIVTVVVTPDPSATCPLAGTASIEVMVRPGPVAYLSLSTPAICPLDTATLIGTVTDNVTGLAYEWYSGTVDLGSGGATYDVTTAGYYSFKVTDDQGCSAVSNSAYMGVAAHCGGTVEECDFNISESVACNTINLSITGATGSWIAVTPPLTPLGAGTTVSATYNQPGIYWFSFDGTTTLCSTANDTMVADTIGYIPDFNYNIHCASGGNDSIFLIDHTAYLPFYSITSISWYEGGTLIGTGANLGILRSAAGSYTIVEDVTGVGPSGLVSICAAAHTVITPPLPVAAFIDSLSPSCDQVPVSFTPASTGGIIGYNWDFGDGASCVIQLSKRTYTYVGTPPDPQIIPVTLTIQDTIGCLAINSSSVTIYPNMIAGDLGINPQVLCSNETPVILTFNYDPTAFIPVSYLWSTGETVSSIAVSQTGAYWITVVDNHHCQATQPEPVKQVKILKAPTANITGLQNYCLGDVVRLSAFAGKGLAYQWYRDAASDGTGATIGDAGLAPGDYNYQVLVTTIDSASGTSCTDTSSVFTVHMFPLPATPVITGPTVLDCNSYHLQLAASEPMPGTYNWSNGTYGAVNDIYTGGAYRVWFTDKNGCISSNDTTIPQSPDAYFAWLPTGCYNICSSQLPLTLYGPAGYSFNSWAWLDNSAVVSSGINSPMSPYTITDNGDYQWQLDNGLCSQTSDRMNITVTDCKDCSQRPITADILCTPDNPASYQAVIQLLNPEPGTTYVLGTDIGPLVPFSGTLAPELNTLTLTFTTLYPDPVPDSVTIEVLMTLPGGGTCYQQVRVPLPGCPAWIGERHSNTKRHSNTNGTTTAIVPSAMLVYPNPTAGNATISYDYGNGSYSERSIVIYDVMGREVQATQVNGNQGSLNLNCDNWTPGVYLIIMEGDGKTLQTQRIAITQ